MKRSAVVSKYVLIPKAPSGNENLKLLIVVEDFHDFQSLGAASHKLFLALRKSQKFDARLLLYRFQCPNRDNFTAMNRYDRRSSRLWIKQLKMRATLRSLYKPCRFELLSSLLSREAR